jgi:hypothetical protein
MPALTLDVVADPPHDHGTAISPWRVHATAIATPLGTLDPLSRYTRCVTLSKIDTGRSPPTAQIRHIFMGKSVGKQGKAPPNN